MKADSWKWMVISPLGPSSSMHFPHLWVWHAIVPAINSARCSFSVSADSVQLRTALTDTDSKPPPSLLNSADVTGCGGRLASSAYPWTVTVLNADVRHQCWEVRIPREMCDTEPDELEDHPLLVCSATSIHVGVTSSDRIMQQGLRVMLILVRAEAPWIPIPWEKTLSGKWCSTFSCVNSFRAWKLDNGVLLNEEQ